MSSEQLDNDGRYWEPEPGYPLKQGDLLRNIPSLVLPQKLTFVLRTEGSADAVLEEYDEFPDPVPSFEIAARASWDTLTMVMTPTCHISEGEKDEDVAVVVPVFPIRALIDNPKTIEKILEGKAYGEHLHLFPLPRTNLGGGALVTDSVALLDRPTSILKHELRAYRQLALYRDYRFELRKKLARFWARAQAEDYLDAQLAKLDEIGVPFENFE